MTRYLLDTNICIYIINRKPAIVAQHFQSLEHGQLGISSITHAELAYGVIKSGSAKNRAALEKFLLPLEIYPFDAAAALEYGTVRAHLERQGTPIGNMDMLIAAHARALKHVIVTNNVREFERVPNLFIENWV